jgi:hypothetical protein
MTTHIKVADLAKILNWTKPTVHYWLKKTNAPVKWHLGVMYLEEPMVLRVLQELQEARRAALAARAEYFATWPQEMSLRRSERAREKARS